MTEIVVAHPAAPADNGSTYGGFAEIARRLNALHPERTVLISRQLVAKWYECRGFNAFPERQPVEIEGKVKVLFDLDAVVRWHDRWMALRVENHSAEAGVAARRTANPPIETIPLFTVDHRGHPVDAEQGAYRGDPGMQENVRSNYRSSVLDL
jgi:hypothetical protein